jgi:hypothetical protein
MFMDEQVHYLGDSLTVHFSAKMHGLLPKLIANSMTQNLLRKPSTDKRNMIEYN